MEFARSRHGRLHLLRQYDPLSASKPAWCAFIHASALLGVFLHFPGHLLPPLILWLIKRDESPELDAHGKEAVNFQISMLIYNATLPTNPNETTPPHRAG